MSETSCLDLHNVSQCHAWLMNSEEYFAGIFNKIPECRDRFLRCLAANGQLRQIFRNWRNPRTLRITRNQVIGLAMTFAELPWDRERQGNPWTFTLAVLAAMSRPDPYPLLYVIDWTARQVRFAPEIAVSHFN